MTEQLTMPEPLDLTRPHHPSEVRAHANRVAAYHEALREQEAAERRKQEAREAATDRVLSEDEYYALSLKLHEAQKQKEAQREAERKAKEDEEAAYLASLPELAEISENSEYLFLTKLAAWIAKGYRVTEESVRYWVPGFYCVILAAPATKGGAK